MELPERFKPITNFVIQVVLGGAGFLTLFLVCVAINVVVKRLEAVGAVPPWATLGADYVERGLFAVDVFCFGAFTLAEVFELIRGLWRKE